MESFINILILSVLAGLATGVGGFLAVIKKPGEKMFGFLIGFAGGVMLIISFFGLVREAWESAGFLTATIGFAIGAFAMLGLDLILPHIRFSVKEKGLMDPKLFTTGVLVALGIAIHNFPEGMSIGAGFLHTPKFGFLIALAITLHNIPEGIATALPIYKSGASRMTACKIALISGLAEPLGAVIMVLFLVQFQPLIPITLAFAAGVMVFITIDELIPLAHRYGHEHYISFGLILGSVLMFLLIGVFKI